MSLKATPTPASLTMTPRMLEAIRQGEDDRAWLEQHPEVLDDYRGQWVVVHKGQIVAHSPDGTEVARAAPASRFPGALLEYIPARHQLDPVHVHTPQFGAPEGAYESKSAGDRPSSP